MAALVHALQFSAHAARQASLKVIPAAASWLSRRSALPRGALCLCGIAVAWSCSRASVTSSTLWHDVKMDMSRHTHDTLWHASSNYCEQVRQACKALKGPSNITHFKGGHGIHWTVIMCLCLCQSKQCVFSGLESLTFAVRRPATVTDKCSAESRRH